MKTLNKYLCESFDKNIVIYEIDHNEVSSVKYLKDMDEEECKEYAVHTYNSVDELVNCINNGKYDSDNLLKIIRK